MTPRVPRGSILLPVEIQPLARHVRTVVIGLSTILARCKGYCRLAQLRIHMVPLPAIRGVVKIVVIADGKRLSCFDNVARDALNSRRVRFLSLERMVRM